MPLADPVARAEYNRAYRAANLEKLQAYHRVYALEWRDKNLELVRQRDRDSHARRYAADPEKFKATELARYWAAPEKNLAAQKAHHRRKPATRLLQKARERAKGLGLPFTITADDIPIPELCPYLGIPLVFGDTHACEGSPSLDRIRPELGYVPGNVEVISYRANRLKNDIKPEEVRLMYDALLARLKDAL